jgi:hypothetical protein
LCWLLIIASEIVSAFTEPVMNRDRDCALTHLAGGHPGDSESRGLFHVDRFWHLEDQIALCAEILSIRTLVLEQPAVDAARNLVAELDVRVLEVAAELDDRA